MDVIREFRLSSPGSGYGISCDETGAFVGTIPLLKQSNAHGNERWEPRDCGELSKQISAQFGLPIDITSKTRGIRAISNALNEGDVARAQIAAVLLGIPDPPPLSKGVRARSDLIKFIDDLHWSGLIKRDWDPNEHPRWPGGSADSQGGQFAPKGFWQTLVDDISGGAEAIASEIGRTQIDEANAERAAAAAIATAADRAVHDSANYVAKPWIGADGQPVQVPIINTGDPNADQGAIIAHFLLNPNAPLSRPGTNADWIGALIGLASAGAVAARGGAGAEEPASPEPAPPAIVKPFITLRAKLPTDLDESIPIGKIEFPDNLIPGTADHGNYAHDQIGKLLQEAAGPDVELELNTVPYTRGVDVRVPKDFIDRIGFEYGEIKPLSRTGRSRLNNQVLNIWKLEGRVQPITYDWDGNIYYGFPGYDQH